MDCGREASPAATAQQLRLGDLAEAGLCRDMQRRAALPVGRVRHAGRRGRLKHGLEHVRTGIAGAGAGTRLGLRCPGRRGRGVLCGLRRHSVLLADHHVRLELAASVLRQDGISVLQVLRPMHAPYGHHPLAQRLGLLLRAVCRTRTRRGTRCREGGFGSPPGGATRGSQVQRCPAVEQPHGSSRGRDHAADDRRRQPKPAPREVGCQRERRDSVEVCGCQAALKSITRPELSKQPFNSGRATTCDQHQEGSRQAEHHIVPMPELPLMGRDAPLDNLLGIARHWTQRPRHAARQLLPRLSQRGDRRVQQGTSLRLEPEHEVPEALEHRALGLWCRRE
mmetsp:Transcript_43056/g.134537  ORF Transcript_43056/g.134537 Transcript_43056/m.134537 type:complete len:337 (-) Transcript_43056:866-1876(-)